MDLNLLWFVLIAVLFTGFFFLEGFDYGVGILLPFLGKNDAERRVIINTIGPFWDANEVWLITAGGAMFAAFPDWYATMFSGYYLVMFLMLLALIIRGAAFEFRSKDERPRWRSVWDWLIFISSLLPGFLWGIAISNSVIGVPIDAHMNYVGGFGYLFNPYALLCGLAFVSMFTLHGALFLGLRIKGSVAQRAHRVTTWLWLVTGILSALFILGSSAFANTFLRSGPLIIVCIAAAGGSLLAAGWLIMSRHNVWAFAMTGMTMLFSALIVCMELFPRLLVSSLNPAWSLTIYNAASSHYTLTIMSWIALSFLPFVLLYQAWNYWIFRRRLGQHSSIHY